MQKRLLLSTVVLAVCTVGLAIAVKADTHLRKTADMVTPIRPPYLEALTQADTLDDPAVGIAGQKSETYQAFEQAMAAGNTIRPELEKMLQQATPAGRLYAALLLMKLDRKAGKQALKQLQADQATVIRFSGCLRLPMTVSQAAAQVLRDDSSLN